MRIRIQRDVLISDTDPAQGRSIVIDGSAARDTCASAFQGGRWVRKIYDHVRCSKCEHECGPYSRDADVNCAHKLFKVQRELVSVSAHIMQYMQE